jgi:hypothetical protein
VCEPAAGRLNPQNSIEFYGRIPIAGLHEQWIAADARGQIAKAHELVFVCGQQFWLRSLHELIPPSFLVIAPFFFSVQYRQRILGLMVRSELRSALADFYGGFENGPNGKYSSQFVRSNGGQAH